MENASKFLIIAGSIIISLVLVGLGVMIYQRVAPSITGAGVDEYEVTSFNSKFDGYFGSSVTGSSAKGLVSTVLRNNQQAENEEDAESKTVYIKYTEGTTSVLYGGKQGKLTDLSTKIKSSSRYKIQIASEDRADGEPTSNNDVQGYYRSGFIKGIEIINNAKATNN